MTDLTPLPGAAEDSPVLATQEQRIAARDIYIAATGGGITKINSYVVSHRDGDVIKLQGGTTGASFSGFLFFSLLKGAPLSPFLLQQGLDNNKRLSRQDARTFAKMTTAGADTYLEHEERLAEIRTEQGKVSISVIRENDNISLNPGEAFTITNNENAIADEFFAEIRGRVQWGIGFEVVETQYNESRDMNDDFGKEIEDRVAFKWLATTLYRFLKPFTPPPEDIEFGPEEEGGFEITTTDTLLGGIKDVFADFGDGVKDVAAMAAIILGSILAIFLMITLRKPIQGAAGGLTEFVKESISR
jgi:hypothetical protein